MVPQEHATDLLLSLTRGNREALDELIPLVYDELREVARKKLRWERPDHTLNTTELVHEAYLKLIQLDRVQWQSRAHFLSIAGQAMRNILVSYARNRKRLKRGGGAPHEALEEAEDVPVAEAERILALDSAIERLASLNPRQARIIECRFFAGMTIEETATVLEISPATIKREWTMLRHWLGRELGRLA